MSTTGIPPKFIGQIVIAAGVNDDVAWHEEDDVVNAYDLSITIPPGSYWPDDLLDDITVAMDAESDANGLGLNYAGVGANYNGTIPSATGIISIDVSHPTATGVVWYPRITPALTDKLLTGGDVDVGTRGSNHFGWNVDASFPAAAVTHSSDVPHGNAWFPNEPRSGPQGDDEGQPTSTVAEFVSWGGDVQAYDFSGDVGTSGHLDVRTLGFEWLDDTSRNQYRDDFWIPYAKQGNPSGLFRFFEDRTLSDSADYVLTGESLRTAPFARLRNLPYWSFSLTMRRPKP